LDIYQNNFLNLILISAHQNNKKPSKNNLKQNKIQNLAKARHNRVALVIIWKHGFNRVS
jgi:hypothetical protein